MSDDSFIPFELRQGCLFDSTNQEFPSRLSAWQNDTLVLTDEGTHFGFVHEHMAALEAPAGSFLLTPGMYFSVPASCRVRGEGRGVVITRPGYGGAFSIGGPIESRGRLRYIDGCTDSLLLAPQMAGDPCLNALYFPPQISQTKHTHPSIRLGLIVRGYGECRTLEASHKLYPGLAFAIRANRPHSFRTADSEMVVIAFHPDSDFGPTHESHPMINRTIVDGVPAAQLDSLLTRSDKA